MDIQDTEIQGVKIVKPRVLGDERGFFVESYESNRYEAIAGEGVRFVQDNISRSARGVLRGLHFQREPHAQGKLASVIAGAVYDVALDMRTDSPTYGKYQSIELRPPARDADGNWSWQQFYVPPGCAHGFLTLEDDTIFAYKCTNFYAPQSDSGVLWSDPEIGITWPQIDTEILVSAKDAVLPLLKDLKN